MKNIFILSLLLLGTNLLATTYTFHTSGNFTDSSNWDIYPGTNIGSTDSIIIDANCNNIDLVVNEGYVLLTEDVTTISILDLLFFGGQLKNDSDFLDIAIYGSFYYDSYEEIFSPFQFILITNYGFGYNSSSCSGLGNLLFLEYWNFGSQDSEFLGCFDGNFINLGTIDVTWDLFYINCDLDLADGTIDGWIPFNIITASGSINQYCANCTATINNVNQIYFDKDVQIEGTVILNSPD